VRIDIHSHMIPEAYIDALREKDNVYGARVERNAAPNAPGLDAVVLSSGRAYELPPEVREPAAMIRELDRLGFDLGVVAPALTLTHYELRGEEMERHTRLVNDGLAAIQHAHGDRLVCMGLLPMQEPEAAVHELDRLAGDLGLRAAVTSTNILGKNLDEPEFRPIFARAAQLGTFIFVHASFVAAAERLTRYHLRNALGYPLDASIAVASVIFGGILDAYPGLKICFAHGGGASSFLLGRLNRAHLVRPEARDAIPEPPERYLDRLYFDTIVHSPSALQYLVDVVGPSRVLAGSDCPYHKTDMGDPRPIANIQALSLTEDENRRILGLNAAQALGLA